MLKLIVAVAENGTIGRKGDMAWYLPNDMKWFKTQTGKNPVVMGSKTFLSLPERFRPLPGRENIVLTRGSFFWDQKDTRVMVIHDQELVLRRAKEEDLFVIGGAEIYQKLLPYVEEIYLTRVHGQPEGDVFFPEWNSDEWEIVSSENHPEDERHQFSFTWEVWRRKQPAH